MLETRPSTRSEVHRSVSEHRHGVGATLGGRGRPTFGGHRTARSPCAAAGSRSGQAEQQSDRDERGAYAGQVSGARTGGRAGRGGRGADLPQQRRPPANDTSSWSSRRPSRSSAHPRRPGRGPDLRVDVGTRPRPVADRLRRRRRDSTKPTTPHRHDDPEVAGDVGRPTNVPMTKLAAGREGAAVHHLLLRRRRLARKWHEFMDARPSRPTRASPGSCPASTCSTTEHKPTPTPGPGHATGQGVDRLRRADRRDRHRGQRPEPGVLRAATRSAPTTTGTSATTTCPAGTSGPPPTGTTSSTSSSTS